MTPEVCAVTDRLILNNQALAVKITGYYWILTTLKLNIINNTKTLICTVTMKSINFLKVLARTSWGANHSSLITVYRSVIRSKLHYGSVVCGSARKSSFQTRTCSYLLELSVPPIPSLQALSGEPPLSIRHDQLALQLYYK